MGSIDDVRERLPIEQVVGEVVSLKRAGSTYKGLCPFHAEKTPSFIVSPSRGTYKCFGCGQGGDIFSFVMATQNLDFPTALRQLAARAGVEVEETRQSGAGGVEARIYEMNAAAATYFQSMLAAAAGARAREYLQRRTIVSATIDRFGLGYAPDSRDGLCTRLRGAGYSDADMVAAGLAIAQEDGGAVRDRFRGRLIFPIRDARGRIVGFGGRLLGDGEPKYLNSPATAVFDKSRVLYTIEHAADAIRGAREGVVVEGYVDALRAHQEGFANVVATLGTAITDGQLRALARLAPRLVLALDADPAGQKAAVRAGLAALSALPATAPKVPGAPATAGAGQRESVQVFVATLPEGQDPDDAIAADPEVWRRAIAGATPLMDHYFALVESSLDRAQPQWRQEAIDTLTHAIGQLPGLGLQQTYIERLATLTGVDARYLREMTPGGVPQGTAPGRRRGATAAPATPVVVDPVRVTEEHLIGFLLQHRPLSSDVRTKLVSYVPLTPDLAPVLQALIHDQVLQPSDADRADLLAAAAAQHPAVPTERVLDHVCELLLRIENERIRREILHLGDVVSEVDRETMREMDERALKTLALKEQLTVQFQKVQAQHRRHLAGVPGDDA